MLPAGKRIRLTNPSAVRDKDRYGRLLRYVDVESQDSSPVDVGFSLLLNDLAEARYDSHDGYQWHPRESSYRAVHSRLAAAGRCPKLNGSRAFTPGRIVARRVGKSDKVFAIKELASTLPDSWKLVYISMPDIAVVHEDGCDRSDSVEIVADGDREVPYVRRSGDDRVGLNTGVLLTYGLVAPCHCGGAALRPILFRACPKRALIKVP